MEKLRKILYKFKFTSIYVGVLLIMLLLSVVFVGKGDMVSSEIDTLIGEKMGSLLIYVFIFDLFRIFLKKRRKDKQIKQEKH